MFFIYKLTSPVGKVYIGKAANVKKRWNAHYNESLKNRYQTHLYRAIRLYGWDAFQKEIIDTVETKEEANQKEIYWIALYHSFEDHEKGYNETPGGDGGKTLSHPWNYGKKFGPQSKERKEHQSQVMKERYSKMPHPTKGRPAWNKGKTGAQEAWNKGMKNQYHIGPASEETKRKLREKRASQIITEETKQKISASLMGRKQSEETKKKRIESLKKYRAEKQK